MADRISAFFLLPVYLLSSNRTATPTVTQTCLKYSTRTYKVAPAGSMWVVCYIGWTDNAMHFFYPTEQYPADTICIIMYKKDM